MSNPATTRPRPHRLLLALLALALAAAAWPAPATAAPLEVPCNPAALVAAVAAASAAPDPTTLRLAAGCTYTLTAPATTAAGGAGLPPITGDLTILGSGATIERSGADTTPPFRLILLEPTGRLQLEDLTLRGGYAFFSTPPAGGGAIYNRGGDLTVTRGRIIGNVAESDGGGIASAEGGTICLIDTLVSGNSSSEGVGGGIANGPGVGAALLRTVVAHNTSVSLGAGAGIANDRGATLTVTDSLIHDNAGRFGAGLWNAAGATATLVNTTLTRNLATETIWSGGGAFLNQGLVELHHVTIVGNSGNLSAGAAFLNSGTVRVAASIIAGEEGGGGPSCTVPPEFEQPPPSPGDVVSLGYNLADDPNCGLGAPTDRVVPQVLLGPLAENGGPTPTRLPLPGSPALDAIPPAACLLGADQRGEPRPQGAGCEIGAVEIARGPVQFPTTGGLDGFNRRDSRTIGPRWRGPGVAGYQVRDQQLAVSSGGPVTWLTRFGADQEAFVTLVGGDGRAGFEGLLLKVRRRAGVADWREGAIRVAYGGGAPEVRVETYRRGPGWQLVARFPVRLGFGRQLGARARADGTVEVFADGQLLGRADTRTTNGSFFVDVGGHIGLWVEGGLLGRLDDFGGGDAAP